MPRFTSHDGKGHKPTTKLTLPSTRPNRQIRKLQRRRPAGQGRAALKMGRLGGRLKTGHGAISQG